MAEAIRILGIDPGLRRTGWGVVEAEGSRLSRVAHGVIAPPTDMPLPERLLAVFEGIEAVIAKHGPHEAAAEEVFMASNAASALKLGHARAAAILAPARAGIPVSEYAARLVKKSIVGTGSADKAQIVAMIEILLPGSKAEADAADALAVAITHAHHRRANGLKGAA